MRSPQDRRRGRLGPRARGSRGERPLTATGLSGTTNAYYAERADGSVVRFRLSDESVRLVPIASLSGLGKPSSRGRHACGVRKGEVLCFGTDDASLDKEKPESVALPKRATAVAAGEAHACALVEGGEASSCWGSDRSGQLGAGRVRAPEARPRIGTRTLLIA